MFHARVSGPGRLALLVAVAVALPGCERDGDAPAAPVPIEVQTTREIAAALFADGDRMAEARAALQPLLDRDPPFADDLLRGAAADLELDHLDTAAAFLKRAEELGEKSARFHYLKALHAYRSGAVDAAEGEFERTAGLAPDDLPTQLMVAACRTDRGAGDAEAPLRRVQKVGPEFGGSWYPTALYRLNRICLQAGRSDEAQKLRQEYSELEARGVLAATIAEMERGNFGRLEFPPPAAALPTEPPAPPAWQPARALAPEFAGATGLLAVDLLDDGKIERRQREAVGWSIGACDLVGFGAAGILAASPAADGRWSVAPLWDRPVRRLAGFDFGEDGDLDFWAVTDAGVELLVMDAGKLAQSPLPLPPLPSAPSDLEVVDYDHEGDLDLLLVGPFGVRLWRADGAAHGGAFTDATEAAGLAGRGPLDWCVVEDLDSDQDVDFLLGGAQGVGIADNLRAGRFEWKGDRIPKEWSARQAPIVADLDHDSRPDLWSADGDGRGLRGVGAGRFRAEGGIAAPPPLAAAESAPVVAELLVAPRSGMPPALARLTAQGLELLEAPASGRTAIRLALLGRKDNRRGVGAIVEVRAKALYQRFYWRGEPLAIDLAGAAQAEWIRVTWPNGVVQSELAIPAGSDRIIEQKEGLIGSCPFLYAWNGTTYGFVTDVLGITPLGLPMSPDQLVPPDHDEYVLVRGDQLVPRDGRLELQLTEELREVTYLDRVRLDVVDHPAGAEVFPNERFTFPPFPEPHVHAVVAPLAPRRAVGSDGRDWTAALRANDLQFAAEFTPWSGADAGGGASTGQFLGLAPAHFLELEFDPAAVPRSGRLRLLLTGWFYWTDASVNVASSRTPGFEFVPPMLEVPDGHGGWRPTGAPIGFPAGKVKTMVIDVGDRLDRADPRLRLSSTLRLYWDSIRLAADPEDAPTRVTSLEPAFAHLHSRGFSAARELPGGLGLEWFDWDRVSKQPRWNQHPGFYTRFGDVRELLGAIDDRFVVMGAGDALTLQFPAGALPPLPDGWSRDYLLFLDGWAKDRDPNTVDALFVEPLPFHAMSGYPYPPPERFPDDAAHRAWLLDWETRPARRWIAPLVSRERRPSSPP
jgi:hypothetical protein